MVAPTKTSGRTGEGSSSLKQSFKAHKDMPLTDTSQLQKIKPAQSIEDWANSIMSSKPGETNTHPTLNLGRFGLKNAKDVIAFLKSPAGEATLSEIGSTIAKEEAIKEQQRLSVQEHNRLMHQIRALLFLWFIEEKSHAAHKLYDLIEQQNAKLLKDEARNISSTGTTAHEKNDELKESLAQYDKVVKAIEHQLENNTDQLQKLDQLMGTLEDQGHEIESKYSEYESELSKLEQVTQSRENLSKTEIDEHLKVIESEAGQMVDQITQSLEANDDLKANAIKHKLGALNIKAAVLFDMRAVHNQEKYYADADGNAVASFKDAHFILNKGNTAEQSERLVKMDNKLYLLKPGQTLDSIKENQQAKEEARNNYKLSKQQFMSVRNIVQHHKTFETTVQKAQISETEQRREQCKSDKLLLTNQMSLVQSARASAEQALNQPVSGQEPPRPTATASKAAMPKPSQTSPTLFYREQIKLLKQSQNISQEDLYNLANIAPRPIRKETTEFLKQEFTKLSQQSAIPQTMMQNLLQRMEGFGVKPKFKKDMDEPSYQSPSPFNTKPQNKP